MLRILTICFLLISVYGASIKDESHLDGRIVGGHAISINQAPYMAAYQFNGNQECGASIISNNFVVTAAHCTVGDPINLVSIRVGSTYRNNGGSVHRASRIINHARYIHLPVPNYDISLVKVETPFVYSSTVLPISLATALPAVGNAVVTSGWGRTTEGGIRSNNLLQVQVKAVNQAVCNRAYSNLINSAMLCAGVPEGGKDSCQNDSGGPLVAGNQLVGIVSFGMGCGRAEFPGVYASVPYFRAWIRDNSGV